MFCNILITYLLFIYNFIEGNQQFTLILFFEIHAKKCIAYKIYVHIKKIGQLIFSYINYSIFHIKIIIFFQVDSFSFISIFNRTIKLLN
jgi:hypothetical protein